MVGQSGLLYTLSTDLFQVLFTALYDEKYQIRISSYTNTYISYDSHHDSKTLPNVGMVGQSGLLYTLSTDLFEVLFPTDFENKYSIESSQYIRKYPPRTLDPHE